MEKTTKRLLGLAIALVLVLGMIPVSQIEVKADGEVDPEVANAALDPTSTTCPTCDAENVEWKKLTGDVTVVEGETAHYYVEPGTTVGSVSDLKAISVSGGTLCLHLGNSNTKLYTTLRIDSTTGATVNLMGNKGQLRNKTTARPIVVKNNVTLNVYGGDIIGSSGGYSADGGTIYVKGTSAESHAILNLYSGTVRAGKLTGSGNIGGNIYAEYADVNVIGCSIYNGSAEDSGGNLAVVNGSLTMRGGQIYGGKVSTSAKSGGNIHLNNSQMTMEGGKIYNGECTNAGGNIYLSGGASVTMSAGQIYGGKSSANAKYGGIFATTGASVQITGGYLAGVEGDAEQNIIYTRVGGTISGATIGQIGENQLPGKVTVESGTLTLNGATLNGVNVVGGMENKTGTPVIRLDGNTQIDSAKVALVTGAEARVEIANTFTGSAYVLDNAQEIGELGYGTVLERVKGVAKNAQTDEYEGSDAGYTGKVYWNAKGAISGNAYLVVSANTEDAAGTIVVGDVQVRDQATGSLLTWQDGVSGVDYSKNYIKLVTNKTLVLDGEDLVVDTNNKNISVSGNGTLAVLDSTNTAENGKAGMVTIEEEADVELIRDITIGGDRYVVIDNDDETASAHKITMQLTSVALSTANAGYYYKAQYTFDDVVAGSIDSYGIAASAQNMPGADFFTEKNGDEYVNAWTTETKALTSGDTVNGHGIVDVLKEGEDNDTRGKTKIYAAPYIVINVSSTENVTLIAEKEVALSLYDILLAIDSNWDDFAAVQETVQSFVSDARWANDISAWEFTKIQ